MLCRVEETEPVVKKRKRRIGFPGKCLEIGYLVATPRNEYAEDLNSTDLGEEQSVYLV